MPSMPAMAVARGAEPLLVELVEVEEALDELEAAGTII